MNFYNCFDYDDVLDADFDTQDQLNNPSFSDILLFFLSFYILFFMSPSYTIGFTT